MGVLDSFRLAGQTALVTGGSRGLGRAMAFALAEAGADLILVGRDYGSLVLAQMELLELGREIDIFVADVGTPKGAADACEQALGLEKPIDILLNNVGGRRADVATEDVTIEQWKGFFDLNLTGALVCCQKIGKPMIDRGRGSIINITSIAGPIAIRGIGGRHYEASKAALAALTRSLAADWAGRGVRVNAIAPGVFATGPNEKWFAEKPEFEASFLGHIPMGRFGEPAELGPAAVFLASDASSYMTGATLVLDGGFTLW